MRETPNARPSSHDIAKAPPKSKGAPATELSANDLDRVTGGDAVISPRDPASGLATGKRLHKP